MISTNHAMDVSNLKIVPRKILKDCSAIPKANSRLQPFHLNAFLGFLLITLKFTS